MIFTTEQYKTYAFSVIKISYTGRVQVEKKVMKEKSWRHKMP